MPEPDVLEEVPDDVLDDVELDVVVGLVVVEVGAAQARSGAVASAPVADTAYRGVPARASSAWLVARRSWSCTVAPSSAAAV